MNNTEHWNQAADSFQCSYRRGLNDYDRHLLEFLKDHGMVYPGAQIIDIGCGVGKYGAALAAEGCEVTLCDISEAMIDHAKANLQDLEDSCWVAQVRDFDEIPLDDPLFGLGFHLAMSTVSPAIHDYDTVKKMSDISNAWCFVSRFARFSASARDRLIEYAGVLHEPVMDKISEDVANIIQCVSRAGYLPMVKYVPYLWEDLRTPEDQVNYLLRRYRFPDQDPEDIREKLLRAISGFLDEDGYFHDAVQTQVAWIYWNKNLPENG